MSCRVVTISLLRSLRGYLEEILEAHERYKYEPPAEWLLHSLFWDPDRVFQARPIAILLHPSMGQF